MEDDKIINVLMETKESISSINTDIKSLKCDVVDLKKGFNQLVKIQVQQTELEKKYEELFSYLPKINKLRSDVDILNIEVNSIKNKMKEGNNLKNSIAVNIISNLILYGILLIGFFYFYLKKGL